MEQSILDFLKTIENEYGFSKETVKTYEYSLNLFKEFIEFQKINYLKINKDSIRNYLRYLDDLKYKNSTISGNLSSLRSFYNYLISIKKIDSNPINFANKKILFSNTNKIYLL